MDLLPFRHVVFVALLAGCTSPPAASSPDATVPPAADAGICATDCLPSCGNAFCDADEDCQSCSADCSCSCGDGVVTPPESCDPPDGVTCDDRCNLAPTNSALVSGEGYRVEDSSIDRVAFLDSDDTLFTVATVGGAVVEITQNVQRARFRGGRLHAFANIDSVTRVAATMSSFGPGPAAQFEFVEIDDLRGSDSNVYFTQQHPNDPLHIRVLLDTRVLVERAERARARFSPSGDHVIVGVDEIDPGAPGDPPLERVRVFPTAGGPSIDLLDGNATRRFDLAPDGRTLVVGLNENGPITDIGIVPLTGGAITTLVTQAGDDGFRFLDDGTTVVFLVPDDPNNPSFFRLETIGIDGTGRRSVVDTRAFDIEAASSDAVVYVTAVDLTTGLQDYSLARIDGTVDVVLGQRAVEEGFSHDGAFFIFRDGVVASGLGDVGRLVAVDAATGALTVLADGVSKATRTRDGRVVHLDAAGTLRVSTLGGSTSVVAPSVGSFDVLLDATRVADRIAYAVVSGAFAGIYVVDL